jgi:hypothetical protein
MQNHFLKNERKKERIRLLRIAILFSDKLAPWCYWALDNRESHMIPLTTKHRISRKKHNWTSSVHIFVACMERKSLI